MEISTLEQLAAEFDLFLPNAERLLDSVVTREMALSQKLPEFLETEMGGRKKGSFISVFAVKDSPLLQEVGTEQIRHAFRASAVVHTYAASNLGGLE